MTTTEPRCKILSMGATFENYLSRVPESELYQVDVDQDTRDMLKLYFALEHVGNNEEYFKYLWNRNLLKHYPIYRDEMEAYKARKAYEWFYDALVEEKKKHDGKTTLDEKTLENINREVSRLVDEVINSKNHTDTEGNGTAKRTEQGNTDANNSESETVNAKGRAFAFRYPESNYTGGVIPYDLDNNPNVEFINNQTDNVSRNETERSGESHTEVDNTQNDTTHDTTSSDSEASTTGKTTDTAKTTDVHNGDRDQTIEDHWVETWTKDPGNVADIYKKILESIPATNFFERFANYMQSCFQMTFLVENIIGDML